MIVVSRCISYLNNLIFDWIHRLFELQPRAKAVFGYNEDEQAGATQAELHAKAFAGLFDSVFQVLGPDIDFIVEILKQVGRKHKAMGVSPSLFPYMGEALLYSLQTFLKQDLTEEQKEAWEEVYDAISDEIVKHILTQNHAPGVIYQPRIFLHPMMRGRCIMLASDRIPASASPCCYDQICFGGPLSMYHCFVYHRLSLFPFSFIHRIELNVPYHFLGESVTNRSKLFWSHLHYSQISRCPEMKQKDPSRVRAFSTSPKEQSVRCCKG